MQILGIPVMRVAGVEADDVIGTVATRAHADGFVVAIASPDKVPFSNKKSWNASHYSHTFLPGPCPSLQKRCN